MGPRVYTQSRFNSSMVQLKAAVVKVDPFQFLYGTIKSIDVQIKAGAIVVSIPLWYN